MYWSNSVHSTKIFFKIFQNLLRGESHYKDCFHAKNMHVIYQSHSESIRHLICNVISLHSSCKWNATNFPKAVSGDKTGLYQLRSNAALKLQPIAGINTALPIALWWSLLKETGWTKWAEIFMQLPAFLLALPAVGSSAGVSRHCSSLELRWSLSRRSLVTQEGSIRLRKSRKEGLYSLPAKKLCWAKEKPFVWNKSRVHSVLPPMRLPAGSGGAAVISGKMSWERSKVWHIGAWGGGSFLPTCTLSCPWPQEQQHPLWCRFPWPLDFKLNTTSQAFKFLAPKCVWYHTNGTGQLHPGEMAG